MLEASVLCVKEHQIVEISGALHYGVPHTVVLARKTPDIIIPSD